MRLDMLAGMASLERVRLKLWNAQRHFQTMNAAIREYYETDPVKREKHPNWTESNPLFNFLDPDPVPEQISLIAGDCLQNLRSSLDYLVWELVEAAGTEPSKRTHFLLPYRSTLTTRHANRGV